MLAVVVRRHTKHGQACWYIANDNSVGPNSHVVTDCDWTQQLGSSADLDVVAN
jgi:hypothetical protein